MPRNIYLITLFLSGFILLSCKSSVSVSSASRYKIRYLDEYVLKDTIFEDTAIGGLSGIDYNPDTGQYYLICDDAEKPRSYQVSISLKKDRFSKIKFKKQIEPKNYSAALQNAKVLDLESMRTFNHNFVFSSEGSIKHGYHPSIFVTDTVGAYQYSFSLPTYFLTDSLSKNQPRHNGVFEGLALDMEKTGLWAAAELPLLQDGKEPTFESRGAPTRITHFDSSSHSADRQFVYPLDKLPKNPKGKFGVNGITSLLQLDMNTFLILERAYVEGYGTQGNTIRIYAANISSATNTLNLAVLKNKSIIPAQKTLLFDFESVRNQLTDHIVDNLEGIAFGPRLSNGNRSLLVVADNNFNPPSKQLNQFILLEISEK